jgi:hypothetical protein
MRSEQFPSSGGVTKMAETLPWDQAAKAPFATIYSESEAPLKHYSGHDDIASSSSQPRVNILGVGVSAVNMESALRQTELLLDRGEHGYVCVTGVHGIMEAQSDEAFREILNRSFLTTPDGMPTVWLGRIHGFKDMRRVYGPDYMTALCERSVAKGYKHFLYGGKAGVAEELRAALTQRFPGLQIVGTYTPPFRPLNPTEEDDLRAQLERSGADVLWPQHAQARAIHVGIFRTHAGQVDGRGRRRLRSAERKSGRGPELDEASRLAVAVPLDQGTQAPVAPLPAEQSEVHLAHLAPAHRSERLSPSIALRPARRLPLCPVTCSIRCKSAKFNILLPPDHGLLTPAINPEWRS